MFAHTCVPVFFDNQMIDADTKCTATNYSKTSVFCTTAGVGLYKNLSYQNVLWYLICVLFQAS